MYPLITCLLAVAGVVSAAMAPVNALFAALIPVIAIALIPKCLKWSGDLMELTAGATASYLGARAGAAKGKVGEGSEKLAEARRDRLAQTKFGKTAIGGVFAGAGAGSLLKTRKSQMRLNDRTSKIEGEREKGARIIVDRIQASGGTDTQKAKAFEKAFKQADRGTRSAMLVKAAQAGNRDFVTSAQQVMSKSDFNETINRNWSDFDGVADYRPGFKLDNASAKDFSNASGQTKTAWLGTKDAAGNITLDWGNGRFGESRPGVNREVSGGQLAAFLADKSSRASLAEEVRQALHAQATNAGGYNAATGARVVTGNAHIDAITSQMNQDGSWS